jgi:salicylate hydroxylase
VAHPRVLIAGGGIGGLTAALSLIRRGIPVEVHEQAAALREVGAGVQLSPNGSRVLYELGIGEAVAAISCETPGKEIRLWNSGQSWHPFDLVQECVTRYGFPYFTVYRPDLLAVLERAVREAAPEAIQLGRKAVGFEEHGGQVALHFADGGKTTGDVLIGADGIHSAIRHQLWGEDAVRFTGIFAWRGVIPMERLPARLCKPVSTNWVGPGRHVVQYPLRRFRLMNLVGVVEGAGWQVESWTARGTQAEMHADFAGWHDDIHRMIDAIETPFRWAFLARDPLPAWGRGRVSLLGDACHPMLPFLAQGAVQAIEDGLVLARALAGFSEPVVALRRYEEARRDRTARMVRGSSDNTKRFHNPELAHAEGAAAYVEREWQADRVRERYEWLYTYDATTVPL